MNTYVLQKFRNDKIKQQDYLAFRLALAVELVGNSCRKSLGGRPHSMEHAQCLRLDNTQIIYQNVFHSKGIALFVQKCVKRRNLPDSSTGTRAVSNVPPVMFTCVLLKIGTATKYIILKLITANFTFRITLNQFISS